MNFSRHAVTTRVIYVIIVLSLIATGGILPLIKVDVGVRSRGMVRPVAEIVSLQSPESGFISVVTTIDNRYIRQGEVFAVLESPVLTEQIRFNKERRQQLHAFLTDLKLLSNADSTDLHNHLPINTPRFQQSYVEFQQQIFNQKQKVDQLVRLFQREKFLYEKNVASKAARDEAQFALENAIGQYHLLIEQQKNRWEMDKITFQNERNELESEYLLLQQELNRYKVRSPVSGTVHQVPGILQHSFVHRNQILGEISPDTNLVAEIFVSPQDIGLIQNGMPVRLTIDTYNHHSWGILPGSVTSIATDMQMKDGQPYFRVLCSLDQTYLELPTGIRGEIKKGMTFQARFIINRRTLFQLLYEKADNWLNPVWNDNAYTTHILNQ